MTFWEASGDAISLRPIGSYPLSHKRDGTEYALPTTRTRLKRLTVANNSRQLGNGRAGTG